MRVGLGPIHSLILNELFSQRSQPGGPGVVGVGAVSDVEVDVAREVDVVRMATPVLAE